MSQIEAALVAIGLLTGLGTLVCLIWSACMPEKRLWPPRGERADLIVWPVTFAHFGAVVGLSVLGWGTWDVSPIVRFGCGGGLLVLGHLLMIPSVVRFGYDKTSGEADGLETAGLYQWSRNPQYVGDIAILMGWVLIGMAPLAALVACVGIAVFIVAPFAEEPWLEARYGAPYRAYKNAVRRFV